jgi:RHS repeat-associated protein
LNYSSDRSLPGSTFNPKALGLGGWTPSILHHYDSTTYNLFFGDGTTYVESGGGNLFHAGWWVTNQDGSQIYYFDSNGNHLFTRDSVTGVTLYSFEYDSSGRISSISDQFNNTETFTYSGSQAKITSAYGQVTTLSFDANGYLASVTNPSDETYFITSSSTGLLLGFQKPIGQKSTVTYDSNGHVTEDLGAGGDLIKLQQQETTNQQTITVSTAENRRTVYTINTIPSTLTSPTTTATTHTINYPDGETAVLSNVLSKPMTLTDSVGFTNSITYAPDPRFGFMAPYGGMTAYTVKNSPINITTQVTESEEPNNNPYDPFSFAYLTTTEILQNDDTRTFTSNYTAQNRTLTYTSPLARSIIELLNAQGKLSSLQAANLSPTVFSYDSRGRLSHYQSGSRQETFVYDTHGNVASSTDALGEVTRFSYDNSNRLVQETLPDGSIIELGYDKNGNVTSITPPGREAHSFIYNLMELISSYLPPALSAGISGATYYRYNLDERLTQIDRPDGAIAGFNYSGPSRLLTSIATPTGVFSYSYVPASSLISSLTSPDNEVLKYSHTGNVLTQIASSGPVSDSLQYTYNADGTTGQLSLKSAAKVSGTAINLSYDKDGLLSQAVDESLTRNNFGAISASTLGGISGSNTFDSFGEIVTQEYQLGSNAPFVWVSYARDNLERVASISSSEGSVLYSYDRQGRLVSAKNGDGSERTYVYDENGNRIRETTSEQTVDATYDAQDRLLTYGDLKFQYNANGDLTAQIQHGGKSGDSVTQYVYDVFGNLKAVALPDGRKITYIVDGQNRRVGKKINGALVQGFIYQNQTQVAAELDGSGHIVKQFIYGEKMDVPDYMVMGGMTYRIISDQVGTPQLVVDAVAGTVLETDQYDEFGIPLTAATRASVLPFGFAGGIYDRDTGLVRFGARDYDPVTGRWTSKDPMLFGGGDTNFYSYSVNDPINFIDPSGLGPGDIFPTINGAGADALSYTNPMSIAGNIEYAGSIFRLPGGYSYTAPNPGTPDSSSVASCPNRVGTYHTHGAYDPRYDNEHFSPADYANAISRGLPSFLGTPNGGQFVLNPYTLGVSHVGPGLGGMSPISNTLGFPAGVHSP